MDEDQPVDRYGQPLPLVVMVAKDGTEVPVRDALGLSDTHYTSGMEFAEPGMTYAGALAVLLGESADEHLVQVPSESEPEPDPDLEDSSPNDDSPNDDNPNDDF